MGVSPAGLLIAMAALVAGQPGALAQATPATASPVAPAAEPRQVRDQRAQEAFVGRRYQEALVQLHALYAEFPDPVYLRNIGRCYQHLKDPDRAIASFYQYLALVPNLPKPKRREVEGFIREMEELRRKQGMSPPPPAPAATMPAAPAPAPVPASASPTAVAGSTTAAAPEATQPVTPPETPPAPADDTSAGSTTTSAATGNADQTAVAVVPPDPGPGDPASRPTQPDAVVEPGNRRLLLGLALTAGVLGVAGVAGGSIFGLQARSKNEDSKAYCDGNECDPTGKSLRDQALDKARLSTTFYVAGGAFLATGVILYLRAPPRSADSAPKTGGGGGGGGGGSGTTTARLEGIFPGIGPDQAALVLQGRF
jgi:hypothetical protein